MKLNNNFPFIPVFYEMARDHAGHKDLSTEVILVTLSLLASRFFCKCTLLESKVSEKGKGKTFDW